MYQLVFDRKTSVKIAVFGLGYVGLANAVLLAQKHEVVAVDISEDRVETVNRKQSPISDPEIEHFLREANLNLTATTSVAEALVDSEFAIIATPTDYDENQDYFNTSSVESVLGSISDLSSKTTVVIKSTIPIGFTSAVQAKFPELSILFSPEFLREGKALLDNLYPNRIVVGGDANPAMQFAQVLKDCSLREDVPILITAPTEAEAIKLFANTYLAMRVSFFNELDTYALKKGLNTKQIIDGLSLDPRIGNHYNNPSFGYGGYCLPKDTRQLLSNYQDVPQTLITAIVESNKLRMQYMASEILSRQPEIVGIYRLSMKVDSDNFRSSSIQGVMKHILSSGVEVRIFEPNLSSDSFFGAKVVHDFDDFASSSDVIVANRWDTSLEPYENKLFTRDIFQRD